LFNVLRDTVNEEIKTTETAHIYQGVRGRTRNPSGWEEKSIITIKCVNGGLFC